MRILDVKQYGIREIIDGFVSSMNSELGTQSYGTKSEQFFENCEIDFTISNVKGIEILMLRRFCSDIVVLDYSSPFLKSVPIDKTLLVPQIQESNEYVKISNDLDTISKTVLNANKIIMKGMMDNRELYEKYTNICNHDSQAVTTLGTMEFKVIARFQGMNIMTILDVFPESTLYVKKRNEFVDPDSQEFMNICIKKFVETYFTQMENRLRAIDILTDVRFAEEFLTAVKNSATTNVSLSHIVTPFGSIPFRSINSSNNYMELVKDVHLNIKRLNSTDIELGYNNITLHIAIKAPIEILVLFSLISNCVYYYEDLKTVIGVDSTYSIPNTIKNNEAVYISTIKKIDSYRQKVLHDLSNEEKRTDVKRNIYYKRAELYEFIPRSAMISFMIHGTISELYDLTDLIYKKYKDISSDAISIAMSIDNISKLVVSTLMTNK